MGVWKIVKARNSSTQVKETSIANLNEYFDGIKKALEGESYAKLISYRENDRDAEDNKKPIPVAEILSYLKCFDQSYGRGEHPIPAYSGKGGIVKKFAEEENKGERENCETNSAAERYAHAP